MESPISDQFIYFYVSEYFLPEICGFKTFPKPDHTELGMLTYKVSIKGWGKNERRVGQSH